MRHRRTFSPEATNPDELKSLVDRMQAAHRYRGPDGEGAWSNTHVALGSVRLAIVGDCKLGLQPLKHRWEGRLVFNGEVFESNEISFYFCSYRSGDGRWLKKSTKQTNRRKAMEFCHNLEAAERAALSHTLTTAQARKLFNEILERAGDEPLDNFTVEEWLSEWVASKKVSRGEKTATRYEKPVKDFLAHPGKRASLPLRAVTPKDVRSFRDAERKLGKSPVTANLAHKIIASALGAAVKMGYILTNPATAVDSLSTHEAKAQKEIFTLDEIARLLAAAPSDDWRGVILLAAFAGIRLGDALRLKCLS